jgi:serine/threonine-protein kinase MRCK
VHPENQSLSFLSFTPVDALWAVELPNQELLLLFSSLGVYVDMHGRKTREKEVMFPSVPLAVGYHSGYVMLYAENHVNVIEASTGEWIQILNLKRTKPLDSSAVLNLTYIRDDPHVVYLHNGLLRKPHNFISHNFDIRLE